MKIFWSDAASDRGRSASDATHVDLTEALRVWTDEVRGVEGSFMGLTDDRDRTIQFMFDEGIPDGVDDASHLRIVLVDVPCPEREGSYSARIALGEVHEWIRAAYAKGAAPESFAGLAFEPW